MTRPRHISGTAIFLASAIAASSAQAFSPIPDTAQEACFNASAVIDCPAEGDAFYGQDAQHQGAAPNYTDNGDGTVTDNVTGLIWARSPDLNGDGAINAADKLTYHQALAGAAEFTLANHDDWRLPTIKEMYSLIDFRGVDPSGSMDNQITDPHPFLNADAFDFGYGDTEAGERIIDASTGLMWTGRDNGAAISWQDALEWAEATNAQGYLDHDDWRLPNIKALQSIVDYTRSPDTTSSAAIDPVFDVTSIPNEAGQPDYPVFWSATTHVNWTRKPGIHAAYVSFGRAMGYMNGWTDVHGAGAQRSDPKTGNAADYPEGFGPQGDAIRILNFARLVRDAD